MLAKDIMTDIIGKAFIDEKGNESVDNLKFGDENKEIKKIATCLTITPDLIRDMKNWGADLVITHEPTFYNHQDTIIESKLCNQKKAAIEDAGFVFYRYHDSMHFRDRDEVNLSFISEMGWAGEFDGDMQFKSSVPISAKEIADCASKKLNIRHPRIVGNADFPAKNFILATGDRGSGPFQKLIEDDAFEIAVCGELSEWHDCEPVRDAAQFGWKKAIVILGHAGSEKFAMKTLAEKIDGKYDGAMAKYFDCGEVFSY